MTYAIVRRRKMYMAQRPACFYCNAPTFYLVDAPKSYAFTEDHIFPKKYRRKRGISNKMVPCCFRCNQNKGDMRPGDFIRQKIDPARWPVINWKVIQSCKGASQSTVGWSWTKERAMHRFSNNAEVRKDILFLAQHEQIPSVILNLPIPKALQFALLLEVKQAVKQCGV